MSRAGFLRKTFAAVRQEHGFQGELSSPMDTRLRRDTPSTLRGGIITNREGRKGG